MFTALNLDNFSIVRLATLIMSLSITVFLFSIKGKSRPTILLAFAFFGLTLFNLSMFIFHAEPYYWQPYNIKNLFQPFLMALGTTISAFSFLLFSYHFPRFQETERREYRIVVFFFSLVNMGILFSAFFNFIVLQRMQSLFRINLLYHRSLAGSTAFQYFLVIFILIRRTERLSLEKSVSWWQAFLKPSGKDARAARALGIVLLLPSAAIIAFLLRLFGILPPVTMVYIVSYVLLLFYFIVIVVYLSNTEERTTFQGKLVFGALVFMLGIIGLVSIIVGRTYEREYSNKNLISSPATIRFTPNQYQSYNIVRVPFYFDTETGISEKLEYGESTSTVLQFAFPFYNEFYKKIHILSGPMIYLGEHIREDGWGGYHPQPAIAPIIMNLDPSQGGGVYLKSENQRATITWYKLPEYDRSSANTVQLILYDNGAFDFSYVELNPDPENRSIKVDVTTPAKITGSVLGTRRGESIAFEPRLIGIHPGGKKVPLQPIRFLKNLPYTSETPGAIFEAYDIDYYRYLHDRMSPLAIVLIASSIFILFFFPLFFKTSLIKPLHTLYLGMEKADSGDLNVTIDPQCNDEIGFLSRSFNQMLQSIKKAERNFQTLAENAQDAILILGEGSNPIYVNRKLSEITGYVSEELMHISFNEIVHHDKESSEEKKQGAFVQGKQASQHYETSIKTKGGKEVPVELTYFETQWHGKPAEVVVLRDITERKKADELARKRLQRLMQMDKLTSLGILAAEVAHEIHNPNQIILSNAAILLRACPGILAVLKNYAESDDILLAGLPYEEFIKSFPMLIEGIEGCSSRIDRMVKGLKYFSRDDIAQPMISLEINEVIQSAVQLVENYLKRATKNFVLNPGTNIPKIKGNAQRLEQVIINLIINACQALTTVEGRISVSSSYDKGHSSVLVTVHDDGMGIPEEHMEHIKEPFFTTKRDIGGTGLGLYVAECIIKEHRGALSVKSSRDKGAVATISLPVEE